MSNNVSIASYDEEREPLKKRPLLDDLWEDLRMRQEIARKKGFEITGVEVQMSGYCAECRRKK